MPSPAPRPPRSLHPLVIALIAAAALLASPARAEPPSRPPIEVAELTTLVLGGREVAGRTIPAAALVTAIEMVSSAAGTDRTVHVTGSEIVGPLDLSRKVVRRGCIFRDTTFADRVDLTGASMEGVLTFAGKTRFAQDAILSEASFRGPVTFEGEVVFDRWFEARRSNFMLETTFDHVTFRRRAVFSEATFSGPVSFAGSRFERDAAWSTHLQIFERVQFRDSADFSGVEIAGTAVFDHAFFHRDASFAGAKLLLLMLLASVASANPLLGGLAGRLLSP